MNHPDLPKIPSFTKAFPGVRVQHHTGETTILTLTPICFDTPVFRTVVIHDWDQFYIRNSITSIFAKILYDHHPQLYGDALHVIQTMYTSDDRITDYSRTYAAEFSVVTDRSLSNQSIFYSLMTAVYVDFEIDTFFDVIGIFSVGGYDERISVNRYSSTLYASTDSSTTVSATWKDPAIIVTIQYRIPPQGIDRKCGYAVFERCYLRYVNRTLNKKRSSWSSPQHSLWFQVWAFHVANTVFLALWDLITGSVSVWLLFSQKSRVFPIESGAFGFCEYERSD